MTAYCVDDRHGTPCPCSRPSDPCRDECDPTARVEADDQRSAARLAGWDEAYITSVEHLFLPAEAKP